MMCSVAWVVVYLFLGGKTGEADTGIQCAFHSIQKRIQGFIN